MEIKNFEELFQPNLKSGQKFVSFECKKLLNAGENYGSVMLQIEVTILNEANKEEIIYCVGKTCPPTEFLWEMFNTEETFKKEINVYTNVVPILNEFGREKGIDCIMDFFAKHLGSRISVDPHSDTVDKDAVLLLENLKFEGYEVCDRYIGFNLECAKLVLRDLATLHAVPIAYKLEKPNEFKTNILPYLKTDYDFPDEEAFGKSMIEQMNGILSTNPKCAPYLSRIEKCALTMTNAFMKSLERNELFTTFVHSDYWVNNTLLKFENGNPVKNIMVDFQIVDYNSLAHDVIFFLYSSVELLILENHSDELIKYYYEKFIETLVRLGCDTTPYTFEVMMKEFAYIAENQQFGYILGMLLPIFTLKEKAKELEELNISNILSGDNDSLHENYFKKLEFVVLDFVKRGWI